MCKEVTLNSLFDLLKKVPVADRQRVVQIAYDAIKPEIESISDKYKEFYTYFNQLENFSLASGEAFTIVESEKDLLKSAACNEGVSEAEYAEKNGIELDVKEDTESQTENSEAETSIEVAEKSNENNDPSIAKLLEDPEVQEKLVAIKAAEHIDNL